MLQVIRQQILDSLQKVGIDTTLDLTTPPNSEMGDFAFPCFAIAKAEGKIPADVAIDIAEKLNELYTKEDTKISTLISDVKAFGSYVNFFLDGNEVAQFVLNGVDEHFGKHSDGKGKKYLVEFGCPNPMKVFHLGHLLNLIAGESVVRVLENSGYHVVRANYQGDVGMHIAKTLWALSLQGTIYKEQETKMVEERVAFLGKAYAEGAKAFEESEELKAEIVAMNKKVYEKDPEIWEMYMTARQWSLDYFETVYKKLGSHFDAYYFESDMFARGKELVEKYIGPVFEKSDGAVIFPGEKYGLHDRVFINSEGFPTYEGKDVGLAERQFADHHPDKIIHIVGKEQTGYFEVVFKALESVVPKSKGKEAHLVGGYLQLKGEQKMSSRTGNVITGDTLLQVVEEKIGEIMKDEARANHQELKRKIALSALKYELLKTPVSQDKMFDMEESVSTSGDSGPYLLYIVARIKSILRKSETTPNDNKSKTNNNKQLTMNKHEKVLLLKLVEYPEVTLLASSELDPSKISHYLFALAQAFNTFYHECPILQAEEEDVRAFRLELIRLVEQVMTDGLQLLGIDVVDSM